MRFLAKALAGGSLALAVGVPSAEADILALGSHKDVIGVSDTYQQIPLRENETKTISFRTAKANTVVSVTFNAVCLVQSSSDYNGLGKVRVLIRIDGVDAHPQSGGAALCAADNGVGSYGAHSVQAGMMVRAAGTHTVQVIAIRDAPAYHGALYSSSTLVQN